MDTDREHIRNCSSCAHPNGLPYLFCGKCGAPRFKIGYWRITIFLSITMSAFLGGYYFQEYYEDILPWNWPLYLLFIVFYTFFAASLAGGIWRLMARMYLWFVIFFMGFFAFYFLLNRDEHGIIFLILSEVPNYATDYPLMFYSVLAAVIAVIFIPAYFRWGRKYGWVVTYRIVILMLLMISGLLLLGLSLLNSVHARDILPDMDEYIGLVLEVRPEYEYALIMAVLMLSRVFLFEIFVFAAIRGYTVQHRRGGYAFKANVEKEDAFTKSLLYIAHIVRVVASSLEQMALYLFNTVVELVRDVWEVVLKILRELVVPTLVLLSSGILLYRLMALIETYIAENRLSIIVEILVMVAVLIFLVMVFLGCKTHFRWRAIGSFYLQFVSWLLPNMLVFFLLISLTLAASSAALNKFELTQEPLPFKIGVLTKSVALLLVVLVGIVFLRKRSLLLESSTENESVPPDVSSSSSEAVEVEAPVREEQVSEQDERRKERSSKKKKPERKKEQRPLFRKARTTFSSVSSSTFFASVKDFLNEVRDKLEGKPNCVVQLARAKHLYKEKVAQIDALEKTKDSITPETFENLSTQYKSDAALFKTKRDHLQREVDTRHADLQVRKSKLEADLVVLRAQQAELVNLQDSGALSRREFEIKTKQLKREIEMIAFRLKVCEKQIGFLELAVPETPIGQPPS